MLHPDLSGKQLGNYTLIRKLGDGAMGSVYESYQASMRRSVAVKVLPQYLAEESSYQARFEQELDVITKLEHPHILPVYDHGGDDGISYIVMRLLAGGTLQERLYNLGLPTITETQKLLGQLAEALDYAHSEGVIHRDIKPSNILFDGKGNAYLADFGIAKLVDASRLTETDKMVGTPAYMSPEQGRSEELDGRSDIYALGVLTYQLLTNKLPFEANTAVALIYKHISEPPPPPSKWQPALTPAVDAVLLRALAKDRAERYASAADFIQALRVALHDLPATDQTDKGVTATEFRTDNSLVISPRKRIRFSIMIIMAILLLCAIILALPGFLENGNIQSTPPASQASIVAEPSDTPTKKVLPSLTPSYTPTLTNTPSNTPKPTSTSTATFSKTPTLTYTPSNTATPEPIETRVIRFVTGTASAQAAAYTATAEQFTYTPSYTPTVTATASYTPDILGTETAALGYFYDTATATLWTATFTATYTSTFTLTPTFTSTNTYTPTMTFTPTNTISPSMKVSVDQALIGVRSNIEWQQYRVNQEVNGVVMALVPTGCFTMGNDGGETNEKPANLQCFEQPFWIDITEVTRSMYAKCVSEGRCTSTPNSQYSTGSEQPINLVTWYQAQAYCAWRGARLPTEREWEYAARGPDNLIYPWGNNFEAENVVSASNANSAFPVNSKPWGISWVGAVDMSGNVWEWTATQYDAYSYINDERDNILVNDSDKMVLRGGSFVNLNNFHSANRSKANSNSNFDNVGFRCAKSY